MRARFRSYGETSTRTRSPGRIRIRKRRILPATWPRTSCPLSSCTRNMAFGSASTTSPSNSTFSSFAKPDRVLDHSHVGCLGALLAFAELVFDLRALGERTEPVALDGGEVHERVLAPLIGGDEAEALLVAEPLHDPGCHLSIHPLHACAAPWSGPDGGFIPVAGAHQGLFSLRRRRVGVGRILRRRLVLLGIELGATAWGPLLGLLLILFRLGRLGLVGVVGRVAEAELVAAVAGVVAEERLRDERLLRRREGTAEAAHDRLRIGAPDGGRERAAVHRFAEEQRVHLGAG